MATIYSGSSFSPEYYLAIQMGRVKGARCGTKWGADHAVTTSLSDIWTIGGTYPWPTSANTLELISSSANDTAAGSGAQTVTIYGLDNNFVEIEETVTMNGTSASTATSQSFRRVYRVNVATVGTYGGTNAGTITCRVSGAGATLGTIPLAGSALVPVSSSQMSMFTVPANHTMYIIDFNVAVFATKQCSIDCWVRSNADDVTTPFSPKVGVMHLEGVSGVSHLEFRSPYKILEKSDIWVSGFTDTGTAEVAVQYNYILVEND